LAAREISPSDDTKNELTKVHYGTQNVLDSELQFFSNSNEKIDSCMNYTRPQLAIEIEQIKNAFIDVLALDILRKLHPKIFLFAKSS
jgi:hypothetical protein